MGVYAYSTFAQMQAQLALKLNDSTSTFYTPAELQFAIQDAFRLWNLMTGDNRVIYPLLLDPTLVWYDLQTLSDSPRIAYVTDFDLYSKIQLLLIEGSTPLTLLTTQFNSNDISLAVQLKRDEFLLRTGCTRTILTLPIEPSVPSLTLPQTVIEAPRAYWLPEAPDGLPAPLQKTDEFATTAYLNPSGTTTPADPITFSAGVESVLNVTLYPPPENEGDVEFITVQSQPLLPQLVDDDPVPTIINIPPDLTPAIMWGALGYLLSISVEAADEPRAAYANARFEQFIDLVSKYPSVMTARQANIPLYADAVEVLDSYSPSWRVTPQFPQVIGLAGQNLLAIPTATAQTITLWLTANANIPINADDEIQLGREVMDALIDHAQSTLIFKCGGSEAADAVALMRPILSLAATRNSIVRSMAIYTENMRRVVDRENKIEAESSRNEEAVLQ